ncbi:MAG TPA: hypothetical protein VL306_01705 [Methylomirabilota bacterium]|nr:hypothetical protein [Methylomirabilota bacterium]
MYSFLSGGNLIIQGCLAAIIVGIFYTLWSSTKVYGGVIGQAIRLLGIGMLFITIAVIERILVNLNIVVITPDVALAQDILNLIGLVFLGFGFSKLGSVTKA